MTARWVDYGGGVSCIDTALFRPGLAACYLVVDGDEAAFIDAGTRNSVPLLLQALAAHQLSPEQVRWVMPTHVHLDHAGGAGALLQHLPNADLLVHERGAAHLINPQKLQSGSLAVYGQARYDAAFGALVPAPQSRVQVVHDGDSVSLGKRILTIIDSPGHAKHHYVVWDPETRGLFCGDSFGVSYPELNTGNRPFIFPPTTPVQFDPDAWHLTIDRLLAFRPDCVYLTHFGKHEHVNQLAADLHSQINRYAEYAVNQSHDDTTCDLKETLMRHSLSELSLRQAGVDAAVVRELLEGDMDLNAQGLRHWLSRVREASHPR